MNRAAVGLLLSCWFCPGLRGQEEREGEKGWKETVASLSKKKPLQLMIVRKSDVLSVDLRAAGPLLRALPLLDSRPFPCVCPPGPTDRFMLILEDRRVLVIPRVRNHHWFTAVLIAGDRARRFVLWDPYGLMSKLFTVRDSVDGTRFADKVNEKMVAKIDKGEVASELDVLLKLVDAMQEALKDMGLREDAPINETEKKIFDEKLEEYRAEWKKRLEGKQGK